MDPIDDPNEILTCIKKKNIKYLHTGKISPYIYPEKRENVHKKNLYHLVVRIFAFRIDENNYVKYLVQKRSKHKKSHPDYYTDSASGHISYKENLNFSDILNDARRELYEEMGVYPLKIKFFTLQEEFEEEFEISYIFIALIDSNITPNPKEVDPEYSRFYSKDELIQLIESKSFIPIAKELWNSFMNKDIIEFFIEKEKVGKEDRIALFIGRFQPFHNGHLHIIKKILEENKYLKIGIGSSQEYNTKTNPFSAKERKKFITSTLKNLRVDLDRIKFYEIPDMYNAKKWVNTIFNIVNTFDILYAPNEWMRNLFIAKNCLIAVPEYYNKNQYNGANIRELLSKNNEKWKDLVPKPVVELIIKIDGIKRIQKLFKN